MLSFNESPEFLEKHVVTGFSANTRIGTPGRLQLFLRPKGSNARSELENLLDLQASLGTPISCASDGWEFSGRLGEIESGDGGDTFVLTAEDALAALDRHVESKLFPDTTVGEICAEIVTPVPKVEEELARTRVWLEAQYQETTLNFLLRLVGGCGGRIYCVGDDVVVSGSVSADAVALSLERDVTQHAFHTALGAEDVTGTTIGYRDANARSSLTVAAGVPNGPLQSAAARSRRAHASPVALHVLAENGRHHELETRATAVLRGAAAGRILLTGSMRRPVSIGTPVLLDGPGIESTENLVVSALGGGRHPGATDAEWWFEATSPEALPTDALEVSANPSFSTAIVVDADDPENLNRARVRFCWDSEEKSSPWLRIGSPYWGKGHGLHTPPKVGDTVVVAWGQWDTDAVILCAVSAGDSAPAPDNAMTFRTDEGHTIALDKDAIVLSAATGHTVRIGEKELSLEHASGGKVNLSGSGLTLSSAGDVEIRNGQGACVKLSGPTVSLNGNALEVT